MIKECKIHGETDHLHRKDSNSYRCRKCASEAVTKTRQNLAAKALEYGGGKCRKCGYDKCSRALEFHHIDPTTKSFRIADGQTRSWKRLQPEIDKCILLCANCHREVHADLWDIKEIT